MVIGFVLAVLWDVWKIARDRRGELRRAVRAIAQEISLNRDALTENASLLDSDDAAAANNAEIVRPLNYLTTAAGDVAFSKGSLESRSIELATELARVYANSDRLNRRTEAREAYRITNGAMSNYATRRKLINAELRPLISSHLQELASFLEALK